MILLSALLLAGAPVPAKLAPADAAAAFTAAGATRRGAKWVICGDDPNPSGVTIDEVRDLNGDGRPEALLSEGGTSCYGSSEAGFTLLSKTASGGWQVMTQQSGMAEFLRTKGAGGWPDISVGGPGFCFPVLRWNGKTYAVQRHEYSGKPCTRR